MPHFFIVLLNYCCKKLDNVLKYNYKIGKVYTIVYIYINEYFTDSKKYKSVTDKKII